MANDVDKPKGANVSTDVMDDIFSTAGEGASFDSSEMQIPFVRLIQAMSPQLSKKKPEYIEGAEQGDAFNTVTSEIWKGEEGLKVVTSRSRRWFQRRDRTKRSCPTTNDKTRSQGNITKYQRTC